MLTRMTDADWTIALEVFRAVRSRRGDKGRDDRRFLEALHYFTVQSVTWRTLPAEFGNWNSIWKRFWRLRENGTIDVFFEALAELSPTADFVQMFDSTVVRAHVSAAGAKGGQQDQALGRSRGGFSTKIHLKTDFSGLPLAFVLTGGEAGDSPQFETLLDLGPDVRPRAAVTDKGYDSKRNRAAARVRGIAPIIPCKANAKKRPVFFPKALYRTRARIEQPFGKLKRFKRIALRCEKTRASFAAFVSLALAFILIKSVHTTKQFDWSHESVRLAGTTIQVTVAHIRLRHGRFFSRARLSARDIGDGLRRSRAGVLPLRRFLPAWHLRQNDDGRSNDLRRPSAHLQPPLPPDVLAPFRRDTRLQSLCGLGEGGAGTKSAPPAVVSSSRFHASRRWSNLTAGSNNAA
ncbi:IS5 family transposase [Methylobacterium sp.]|uniref:IS5 family transposase n=1 Tax=Methylobacterium sp. TaxID=409 RepID=UPI003B592064